ncbi:MAG: DUF883 domain-containing protein [Pedosphaera sp.]|nr:DUF883 domain-containing protein [Pedosphaera sp.]
MNAELNTDRLVMDMKNVVQDAEDLMKATAGEVTDKAKAARDRLAGALESARDTCTRLEERAVAGAKAADRVVREHPYQSIGIAFGVGILIGVLVGKR